MAFYLAPNSRNTEIFNVQNFAYQNQSISYKDAMDITTDQIINSKKTFLQEINTNGITDTGITTLKDMLITGDSIIGDNSALDTLIVKCANPVFQNGIIVAGESTLDNVSANNLNVSGKLYFNQGSDEPISFSALPSGGFDFEGNIHSNGVTTSGPSTTAGLTDTVLIQCKDINVTGDIVSSGITDTDSINGNNINFTGNFNTIPASRINYINSITSNVQNQIDDKNPVINSFNRLNTNLIGDGTVSNAVFPFIKNLSSDAQNQLGIISGNVGNNTNNILNNTNEINILNSNVSENTNNISNNTNNITNNTNEINLKAPKNNAQFTGNTTFDNLNGIDALKFSYLEDVSSSIQGQLYGKQQIFDTMYRLDAALIGDGSVSNESFSFLQNITENVQNEITNNKTKVTDNTNQILINKNNITINTNDITTNTTNINSNTNSILLLAPLNSPAFTSNPTCPNQLSTDNSSKIANTLYVNTAIANLVDSAPNTLNTLNELSTALGGDNNFSTTMATALSNRVDVSSNQTIGGNKTFSGASTLSANVTIGTNSAGNTLMIYSNPILSNGLVVTSGSVSLPVNSVDSSSINNSKFIDNINDQSIAGIKTFSNSPLIPTPTSTDNTSKVANTIFVNSAITNAKTNINLIGIPTVPTAATSTSTTQIASTEYVKANVALLAPIANPTFTGGITTPAIISNGLITSQKISETVATSSISSNLITFDYNNGGICYVTGLSGNNNFQIDINNIPANSYKTFTVTLMIDSTSFKAYASALKVNGTLRTIKFSAVPDVSTATSTGCIMQQISIIYTGSSSVPYICVSNVSTFI